MRPFACPNCRSLIDFQNTSCVTCGHLLGYARVAAAMQVLDDVEGDLVPCVNRVRIGCNWLAPATAGAGLCDCCELTRTRPADTDAAGVAAWAETEAAKRHLLHELDALGLPTTSRVADPDHGLAFDLLSSAHDDVITGHADGVVTIDLAEGADSHREALRISLAEPYRTVLGHLRHETGHWYWQVLVESGGASALDAFRDLFGDERADYATSLERHYGRPDDRGWTDTHVSHYAASHPWEDWAETFAHYLHIRDTYDTAARWRMRIDGPDLDLDLARPDQLTVDPSVNPTDFDALLGAWLPLTYTLNAVNRSMGRDDLYPFVLTPVVLDKLRFVHDVVNRRRP